MMQIQNSKSETPFSCSEFYELWSFRISDFGFRICLEGGLVPSDDFWADLPSEKAKILLPKKDQPEVVVPKSLTTKQRVDVVSTDTTL